MKRTSVSLIALMSILVTTQTAEAGISDMINNFFTFRQDQKALIAPERTLPAKHIISPNYNSRASEGWARYYTRADLQATQGMDSSSMVMRPDPNYKSPKQAYMEQQQKRLRMNNENGLHMTGGYGAIERRGNINNLEKYQGNILIGNPGQNPFFLDNTGKAGKKTQIGKPKNGWQSAASSKVHPRIGDYDYVKSHNSTQTNNAFGDYSGTIIEDNAREVTRSSGYFTKGEVPLPSQNSAYYNQGLPTNYNVQPNDSLSGISGKEKIYGDWKMWPLIYDKNRKQIQDPDLIHPKQNLSIPRGTNSSQNDDARTRASNKRAPYSFYDGR